MWSHKWPLCEGYMRMPWVCEIPIAISSLLLSLAFACGLFLQSNWLVVVIAATVFCYFLSGILRYFCFKFCDPIYYHS